MGGLAAADAVVDDPSEVEAALQSGDVAGALVLLQPAARAGDSDAQTRLGQLHEAGRGTLQDYGEAARWYGMAADAGHAEARNRLARLYAAGLGVERNPEKAFAFYAAAAQSGIPQYVHDLAVMYDNGVGTNKDHKRAAELYEQASAGGLIDSTANLGVLYFRGEGVEQDLERAHHLFMQAAQEGHAKAQNNLGLMYTRGEGVAQDHSVAAGWFRRAADQGLPIAMTNLGVMYANGFGVPLDEALADELFRRGGQRNAGGQDMEISAIPFVYDDRLAPIEAGAEALGALRLAARQGDPLAQFGLGYIHLAAPFGGAPDYRQGAHWMRIAAEKGLAPAMTNLGLLYFRGRGVPQDFVRGYMWLNRAAASGLPGVVAVRDLAAVRMTAGQINEAQAMAAEFAGAVRETVR